MTYQDRKDIDKLYDLIWNRELNEVNFITREEFQNLLINIPEGGESSDINLENLDVDFNYTFGLSGRDDIIDVNIFLKEISG